MSQIMLVSEIVESNGKTIRENNMELQHQFPLKSLVEIVADPDYVTDKDGLRVFVVGHARDCDGEPLYHLSMNKNYKEEKEEYDNKTDHYLPLKLYYDGVLDGEVMRNYGGSSLKLIKSA